jgi:hypothetical protein
LAVERLGDGCRVDLLSVGASMKAGIGGTGGGGDTIAGLGGGERQRDVIWARVRFEERGDEYADESEVVDWQRLFSRDLRAPNSSSSPNKPAFALQSRRSCDRAELRVFLRRGEPIRLGGIGGEFCRDGVTRDLECFFVNGGGDGRGVGTSCGEGIGGGGEPERER